MKVLFITRKWPPAVGGMETYSKELASTLSSRVELSTLTLPGQPDGSPPSLLQLLVFLISSAWHVIWHGRQYEVIHIGDFVLAPLGVLARIFSRPAKVTMMIHGLDILYGNRRGGLPMMYRVYQRILTKLGCADHYIANSTNTGDLCVQYGLTPVEVIPLGVSNELKRLENDEHDYSILFLGRLVKRKGAAWFASNVLPKLPENISFIVVGKVWDKSEETVLKASERTVLKGFVEESELTALKSRALVAVLPNQPSENQTDVEGFGIVAAELAVQGVPTLVSSIEGLTSAVQDQETGFLIPHDDIEKWVGKINEIIQWGKTERREFCDGASQKASLFYNWDRVADETVELFKTMLMNTPSKPGG